MPDGFRVADAFVGLTLDRDQLRADLAGLPAEFDGEVDAAGRALGARMGRTMGDEVGKGLGDGIGSAPVEGPATEQGTRAGDRFGSSFSSKVRAALAALPPADIELDDEYAQAKLDYIREELIGLGKAKIGVDVSDTDAIAKLTVLRTELDELRAASPSVQVKVDTAAASVEIDKFLAATEVKADAAGKKAGQDLSSGMASSASAASPLIVSAIAGGLIAGGPAISAASILLFGGLAAAAASQNAEVKASFSSLKDYVLGDVQVMAHQSSGEFVAMAGDIQAGFMRVEPTIRSAMAGAAVDIHDVVDSLVIAADTAIPAFNRAIEQGQPVVQGLDALVRDLGSGVAGMLDQLTAHSGAEGAVLSDLGQTVQILLPMIGQLLGEGAELGQDVLPLLNGALGITSDALHLISPVLPEVVAGFVAFKAVSAVSGPLDLLSAKMQTVAADSEGLTHKLSGVAAQGVSGLANALPVLGISLGVLTGAWTAQEQMVNDWSKSLLAGGQAASQATAEMDNSKRSIADAHSISDAWNIVTAGFADGGAQLQGYSSVQDKAQQGAKALYAAMSPLEQKQQDVTTATNELQRVLADPNHTALQASSAASDLASKQAALTGFQDQLKVATQNASGAQQTNADRLQDLSNKASAANTQISLLKGALDALTGANMTADQAEIAVTQAVATATQSVQGQTGALVTANGQLDLHSQKGAAAASALMNLAGAQHNEIAVMEQQGATTDQVSQKSDQLRNQFIQTARQMGFNAGQAQDLANRYFGIPGAVHTEITASTPNLNWLNNSINWAARDRSVQIYGVYHGTTTTMGMNAAGGKVANTPMTRLGFDGGGKVAGPGGPTDDLVPVIGPRSDADYRLSPTEWVIKGSSSSKYGDAKMAAVNDGTAVVSLPGPQPSSRVATAAGMAGPSGAGGGISVSQLTVNVNIPAGTAVITDRDIPPAVTAALQQALVKLERARR